MVNPLVATYRTKDGRHIQLVFLESDRYWAPFCELVGRPDLADDPRFADHQRPRRQRRGVCRGPRRGVRRPDLRRSGRRCSRGSTRPWAPVQAVEELLDDPQVAGQRLPRRGRRSTTARRYRLPRVPVQFDERPPDLRRAPEHGEHTEEVLLELGYSWDDIAALGEDGGDPVTAAGARARRAVGAVLGRRRRRACSCWPAAAAATGSPTRPDLVCPHCGSTDPAFGFEPRQRPGDRPLVDGRAPVVPARLRRRPAVRAGRRRPRRAATTCG